MSSSPPAPSPPSSPQHRGPNRRRANTVLATVSAILEQPLDSFRKLAVADGPAAAPPRPVVPNAATETATETTAEAAAEAAAAAEAVVDNPVVFNPSPAATTRGSNDAPRSGPPRSPGPNRRRAQSVLESVSTLFKQPLESFQSLMESSPTAPSEVLVPAAAAAAKPFVLLSGDEANSQAQSLVALAWDEVGLGRGEAAQTASKEEGEREVVVGQDRGDDDEVSLFDCGGDLETVLLLSWWYRYRGHGVSMYNIIENPTRRGQARLFSKKV